MPRTGRVVSLTGYNHIIARGNGGICIFEDDEDRYRMLTLFEDKLVGNGIGVTAWCLMSNHFHLMVDDPHRRISSCMSGILTSYVKYFNRKTDRVATCFRIGLRIFRSRMIFRQLRSLTTFTRIQLRRAYLPSTTIVGRAIGRMPTATTGLVFAIQEWC